MAGALTGAVLRGKLEAAGFVDVKILEATGVETSRFTAAFHLSARKL